MSSTSSHPRSGTRVQLPKGSPSTSKKPSAFIFTPPVSESKSTPPTQPEETSKYYEQENESKERVYDESEVCYSKVHTTHETNDSFGKIIIWENAPETKRPLFTPYVESAQTTGEIRDGRRTPLAKFTVSGGHKNGRFRLFYPNGQVKFETKYNMNRETGPRKFWNESGDPVTHLPTNS